MTGNVRNQSKLYTPCVNNQTLNKKVAIDSKIWNIMETLSKTSRTNLGIIFFEFNRWAELSEAT